jgi:hypothetical protein
MVLERLAAHEGTGLEMEIVEHYIKAPTANYRQAE